MVRTQQIDAQQKFISSAPAQEVTRATRARTVITANIAQKKAARAVFASVDD
jgi:hypothetical protein